ncbi:lysine N(6)-hydroxylase/L-ornithine N(5)-oxygenase family protein [Streptomyces decoyicus]
METGESFTVGSHTLGKRDMLDTYDLVGVGFGPSNLSLATALEEYAENHPDDPITATFFERQHSLGWHRGMLLPSAKMQISYLKDLVTFRNPTSRLSFISYLHAKNRLALFVNNQDAYPTRKEFHDYLKWVESHFSRWVTYSSQVSGIALPPGGAGRGPVDQVRVEVRNPSFPGGVRTVNARNLVVSTGLAPKMPATVMRGRSVWHSSEFLHRFNERDPGSLQRVAVVGAGQSAAEIVRFLYDKLPHATVSAIIPSYGYSVADDTPFANKVFDAGTVDEYYHGSQEAKDAIWNYHRNTNYAVADGDVIRDLHQRVYADELTGDQRLRMVNLSRVEGVRQSGDGVRITILSKLNEQSYPLDVDVLVCATGYDAMDPTDLLGELDAYCLRDRNGRYQVERDYRIVTTPELAVGIYLQGGTEHTHGLPSSLLSNMAIRSGEITDSVAAETKIPARPDMAPALLTR